MLQIFNNLFDISVNLILLFKKSFTNLTLKVYNAKIKRGVITIENLNPLEKQFYDIFTAKNATERIAKCQEAYDLMQKELNEI